MKDITILVVDDVEANRIALQYLIHEYLEDVELLLATSGEEALKITYKNDVDIIILDIQMPGLDGFDTAKYLKSNPKTQNIPIIFLTAAFKEEEFQQKGFVIGAIDYFTKPIDNHQFINKLKLYIEIIIKNKQLASVNDNLYSALQKEIELKEKVQEQQIEIVEQSKMAALGEMIGNIAHQWRQPLSVISTCASGMQLNLELGIDKKEDQTSNIKMIMKTTQDLSRTIDTFRDFTYKDKLIEFDINSVIDKCISTKEYILQDKELQIITSLEENVIIENLPNSLFQALINIIQNSIEALDKVDNRRFILINTHVDEYENIIIKIKDTAGGVKTEYIHKIFEPYFTTKHKSHGIGLGLNVVYKIINDSMFGKIKARNKRFNYDNESFEGTEIEISLPLKI